MYIQTIVRCDVIFGEIEIFMPIKAMTRSMCEKIYTDAVTEDTRYLLKEYGDEDNNFEYTYRIDEYKDLIAIKKHPIDIVQDTEHHPSFISG
jgi:hypothetical protein